MKNLEAECPLMKSWTFLPSSSGFPGRNLPPLRSVGCSRGAVRCLGPLLVETEEQHPATVAGGAGDGRVSAGDSNASGSATLTRTSAMLKAVVTE